jgi:menaquinol-cytochrome c reductase iron-sulfur subunit
MADRPDRRGFLKLATCGVGAGVGLVVVAPVLKLLDDPSGKITVTTPTEPIDLGAIDRFQIGADPTKVEVIAPLVKDAWTAARNVVLGGAWIRRTSADKVEVFSAVCPHLGCGVGWEGKQFGCPCHNSKFAVNGDVVTGPSKRGLDALPIQIKDGRLRVVWVAYKLDTGAKELG